MQISRDIVAVACLAGLPGLTHGSLAGVQAAGDGRQGPVTFSDSALHQPLAALFTVSFRPAVTRA